MDESRILGEPRLIDATPRPLTAPEVAVRQPAEVPA
jgi:hypothetical protein